MRVVMIGGRYIVLISGAGFAKLADGTIIAEIYTRSVARLLKRCTYVRKSERKKVVAEIVEMRRSVCLSALYSRTKKGDVFCIGRNLLGKFRATAVLMAGMCKHIVVNVRIAWKLMLLLVERSFGALCICFAPIFEFMSESRTISDFLKVYRFFAGKNKLDVFRLQLFKSTVCVLFLRLDWVKTATWMNEWEDNVKQSPIFAMSRVATDASVASFNHRYIA